MSDATLRDVEIAPKTAVAGRRGTWKLTFTIGAEGMQVGGALRIRPPQRGMVRWEVGKVTAEASRPGATCEIQLFDCHPISYHWRHAPIIQVDVYGTELQAGDTITVTIGERGGYSRGYFVRARAQKHAQDDAQWDFWIDTEGNKSVQREREIDDPWVPLEPILMDVRPDEMDHLSLVARQPDPDQEVVPIYMIARDRYDNFSTPDYVAPRVVAENQVQTIPMVDGWGMLEWLPREDDVVRLSAVDPVTGAGGTSNPICRGFAGGHTIYFGDLHVMTGEGIITGALKGTEYAFLWARNISCLDFCTVTNHANLWDEDTAIDDEFNEPGRFVTIPGCENGFSIGHKNVYFPTTDTPPPDASSVDALFQSLQDREALVIPHHTSVHSESSRRTFWTEHDFDTHNAQFERLIEMTQDRGSMEREEVGGNVYFGGTGSSVWSALQRGMKVGFVGGTDTHRAQPGETNASVGGLDPEEVTVGGLTAVLADDLTREAIWEALYSRRCYATQGQRTLLRIELDDYPMGSIIEGEAARAMADSRRFNIRVVPHRAITAIELIRSDGDVTDLCERGVLTASHDLTEGTWDDADPLADIEPAGDAVFYYLRVTESDGRMAWSSPIWIML